jgi:superfamily II DNA or RNA helicase
VLDPGARLRLADALGAVRSALRGPAVDDAQLPHYLLPHQVDATQRLCGALRVFGGALLADAVGLGKSYVACAVAGRYRTVTLVVPAALREQWTRLAAQLAVHMAFVTHEALSRGACVPHADLIVVDEAHRFRNPDTRRYDRLARGIGAAHVLLVTATPVVNAPADLVHLLRLFLADHALSPFGVASLEAKPDLPWLLHAVLPLSVARTERAARLTGQLPVPRDSRVERSATVPPETLARLLAAIARLRFPPLGTVSRALLRRHLLHRLASSVEALHSSVRRHAAYIRRATDAAHRGERLSRPEARRLLSEEPEDQLVLDLMDGAVRPLATKMFAAEQRRLDALASLLRNHHCDAKRAALRAHLEQRRDRKTIVFTSARDTAVAIARAMGWRRLAVVTGSGARIASGPLPVAEALARFAPRSQAAAPAPPAMRLDVLVATDLASEGLNLQDADAIVHYDLPWNPLRLAQRLGRIARLGSEHREVHIQWFAPPAQLEHTLRQLEIIERKARAQLALPVATTGTVGRARVVSATLETRELLAMPGRSAVGYVVVPGLVTGLVVVRWETGGLAVREVISLDGEPLRPQELSSLLGATEERGGPFRIGMRSRAVRLLRNKLRTAAPAPLHDAARPLGRRILALARQAGTRRDARALDVLDRVLSRLREGVAVGAERELAALLATPDPTALSQWLHRHPVRRPTLGAPTIETLVVGNGDDSAQREG